MSTELAAAPPADIAAFDASGAARGKIERPNLWIEQGSREFRRAGIALFLVGFASFSLIYCVQPLLPAFTAAFHVGPAQSSLALSLTTGLLAVSIVLAGAFSQGLGRRALIIGSMISAGLLNLVAANAPDWHTLLAARALEGFLLGGVPAVSMAYLAEEIAPSHLGKAMGLYIAGTAFGAMMGRVGMGMMTEFASWRVAMGGLGVLCLLSAFAALALLPPSRNFTPGAASSLSFHVRAWKTHLGRPELRRIFAIGFVLTSIFVTIFNYATFRLSGAPYGLGQTQVSLIFLAFAFGIVSSSLAGALADRFGRRPLLIAGFGLMLAGVGVTLAASLVAVVIGIALMTTGFFVGHSVASSSIGPLAGKTKGHAASLYLLFYYIGSSVTGSLGGWFWQHGGWSAVAGLAAALAAAGLALSAFVGAAAQQE